MGTPALLVRKLRKSFVAPEGGRLPVVAVSELDLAPGERLLLEGESGSGKTTLLHLIAGILPADSGQIEIAGEPMSERSELARDRLRARKIGYLFQTFNLLAGLTALENVALGMTFRGVRGRKARSAATDALQRTGLGKRLHHRPAQLSVGQQQRVAIARALVGNPALVLADEPTSNLDRANAEACMKLLLDFCEETQAGLLVVTHDERLREHFPRTMELVPPATVESA